MSASTANGAEILGTGTIENLQACEDEPIRIPGSIQRHGFLLLLDQDNESVIGASQNAEEFLSVPLSLILGTKLETVLDREILGALRVFTSAAEELEPQTYLGSFALRGKFYSVVTHRVDAGRVLEFELMDRLVSPDMANQVFANFVSKLSSLSTEQSLCDALVKQIKILTGFNRVTLYRFDDSGHGSVLSEDSDAVLPSYLDLRFPASDIPKQARELYILNTVRIIPNAMYEPSMLHGQGSRPMQSLDLSMSILRSVSPVHVEYMKNMGTMSSMSVSLICDGKLWGLVSGHHAKPHMVPYLVRSACDLLTKLVCTQLMNFKASSSLKTMVHFHSVQRRMLTQLVAEKDYFAAMRCQMADVLQITDASGVALVVDGHCEVFGLSPGVQDVMKLTEWMDSRPDFEVYQSHDLGSDIEWASKLRDVASGILVIRISSIRQGYLMWFRPEIVQTVSWAGEPKDKKANRLNPRTSFEQWKELVRGSSKPWADMEIESATEFRAALTTISLKRAEEAIRLGEARFLQLTHALPNPVWTTLDGGELTYVNQKWLDHGLTDHGVWFEQDRIIDEDRARCAETWKAAVNSGTPFEMEVRLRSPIDGTDRWNLVRVIPYFGVDQSAGGWVGTCIDLTDRRQHEAALRMTEKLALTGRMTSVIAHEINNPLESITNLLYLLREHVERDESARTYIGMAEMELRRISGITKQTLRWSKEGVGRAEHVTAGDLFQDVLKLYAGKIKNRQVSIVVEGGAEVRFFGMAGQLGQVMANLVSNAIQAVRVGGCIWLSSVDNGDTMDIIVRDDGCGMSEETLRNLFKPFYSTKGDLGNGLGLYISHEIVERNGGSLTVHSELERGTEMRVTLPTREPATN
jgi:light-regulated signal transduction histidine kinase (bacteriophytochrome)